MFTFIFIPIGVHLHASLIFILFVSYPPPLCTQSDLSCDCSGRLLLVYVALQWEAYLRPLFTSASHVSHLTLCEPTTCPVYMAQDVLYSTHLFVFPDCKTCKHYRYPRETLRFHRVVILWTTTCRESTSIKSSM